MSQLYQPRPWADRPVDYAEPTPWPMGITVAVFVGSLAATAAFAFGAALAAVHPLLAIGVNLVAAAGVVPTVWRWRSKTVARWVIGGLVCGVPVGWAALLLAAAAA